MSNKEVLMRVPKVRKRRYYDLTTYGKNYMESDNDFIENNLDACVWFLEHRDEINKLLKEKQS
jgi:hypothetical protein